MILYIETNFLMPVAMGRDASADDLLRLPDGVLRIVLPDICLMEAFSAFEDELHRRNRFQSELDKQLSGLRLDRTSANAANLLAHVEAARVDDNGLLNDIETRLRRVVRQLTGQTEGFRGAELCPLTPALFVDGRSPQVPNQPTDTLILAVISEHGQRYPNEEKALLTGNSRDFGVGPVQEHLSALGIRYFSQASHFLGWFNSRIKPDAEPKN